MRLTDLQIAQLLWATGWRGDDLETAIRIVMGESEGNTRSTNVNTNGTIDRGLFQINNKAWPKLSEADAYDAEKNAQFAFGIYTKQKGFREGHSAWWGPSKFHTLRKGAPDTNRIERAKKAREQVEKEKGAGVKLAGFGLVWGVLIASLVAAMMLRNRGA